MFLITENDIINVKMTIDPEVKPVPSVTQVYQIVWSKKHPKNLSLNYLTCPFCTVNNIIDSCNHSSLNPTNWFTEIIKKN